MLQIILCHTYVFYIKIQLVLIQTSKTYSKSSMATWNLKLAKSVKWPRNELIAMRQISVQDKSKLVGQTNWDPTKRTQFEAKMISNFNFRRLWKLDGCDGSGGKASNTDTEGPEFEYHWDWGRFFAKFDDIVNWKKSVMPKIKLSAARSRSRDSNHCSIPTPHDCFIVSQEIAGKDCQCRLGQKIML